jgi:hypothetical protein
MTKRCSFGEQVARAGMKNRASSRRDLLLRVQVQGVVQGSPEWRKEAGMVTKGEKKPLKR